MERKEGENREKDAARGGALKAAIGRMRRGGKYLKRAFKCNGEENKKKEMSVRTRRWGAAGKVESERKGAIAVFLKHQTKNKLLERSIGRND